MPRFGEMRRGPAPGRPDPSAVDVGAEITAITASLRQLTNTVERLRTEVQALKQRIDDHENIING